MTITSEHYLRDFRKGSSLRDGNRHGQGNSADGLEVLAGLQKQEVGCGKLDAKTYTKVTGETKSGA